MEIDSCSSSGDEYEEPEQDFLDVQCLFCEDHGKNHATILEHILQEHRIDFVPICKANQLDIYQFFKLINYIRKHRVDAASVEEIITMKVFDQDQYSKPHLEDDNFLMYDYDDESGDIGGDLDSEDLTKMSREELLSKCQSAEIRNAQLVEMVDQMRSFIQTNIAKDEGTCSTEKQPSVFALNEKTDSGYIESYSHFSIHHVMLSDRPRTEAYQQAILKNRKCFEGKTVLDIGCGTGILSLFAAQAGAKQVVAIDHSDIIYQAMDIIYRNGFSGIIKTVKNKVEKIDFIKQELPTKYDIIISEWMGYFLLFEGMLDTVLYARDNLLNPNGLLLPNSCSMSIAAFSDSDFFTRNITFWNDVYGFNMSSMIKEAIKEATIDTICKTKICSTLSEFHQIDLNTCSLQAVQTVESKFSLTIGQDCHMHGLVGWFNCDFQLPHPIQLDTSPQSAETHWKQTIFPFEEPIKVNKEEKLAGEIKIFRDKSDVRSLRVEISLLGRKFAYHLSG